MPYDITKREVKNKIRLEASEKSEKGKFSKLRYTFPLKMQDESVLQEENIFTFKSPAITLNKIIDNNFDGPWVIKPGAVDPFAEKYNKLSRDYKIPILWSHNTYSLRLGRVDKVFELNLLLIMVASLPLADKRIADEILPQMKLGGIGISIGANAFGEKKEGVLYVEELELVEISLTNFPADNDARALSSQVPQSSYAYDMAAAIRDIENLKQENQRLAASLNKLNDIDINNVQPPPAKPEINEQLVELRNLMRD